MESYEKNAEENLTAFIRKDENNTKKNVIISIVFFICDYTKKKGFGRIDG